MRRIYESRALEYDDEDPHAPKRRDDGDERRRRSIDWDAASHALLPTTFREWAIGVDVETDREVYAVDEPVRFEVRLVNRIPFPVTLKTESPVRWTWSIDGLEEASHVTSYPEEADLLEFGRSERKVFTRNWPQRIRESHSRWVAPERGEHTLDIRINVSGAEGKGLAARTTFRIE